MLFGCDSPRLVGIAKMASESELLDAKRRVSYFELPTRRFLNRVESERVPFRWSVNPYRGCEFGCKYCYARFTHEFMELRESRDFEERIFAKEWNAASFRQELMRIPKKEGIAIGTATDPYQPAERRYGITRSILEVFARERGWNIGLITKSDLAARDVDVFRVIAQSNILHVNFTITTIDERLARLLEPYAPRPSLRLSALRTLSQAGIHVGVLANPVMPAITDSQENLDAVAAAAAEAGAESLGGGALFLKPCALRVFIPFLEEHFPHLARRYKERYGKQPFLRGPYAEEMKKRVSAARAKYGLSSSGVEYTPDQWPANEQLSFFES